MKCPECTSRMKKIKGDYEYKESGLDNVILKGINIFVCSCGEEMPVIPRIINLHATISIAIIKTPVLLDGPSFRFLRKELGFKAKEIANIMGVDAATISRWETGKIPIGTQNDKLMRMIFVQILEERCGKVFKKLDPIKKLASIKKSRKRIAITITGSSIKSICELAA